MPSPLARVNELQADFLKVGRSLKSSGAPIAGYSCTLSPKELIHAAGFSPFMLRGAIGRPTAEADRCLEPLCCGMCRSALNLGMQGKYDFLDAVITCHACNNMDPMHSFWKQYINPPLVTTVNTPHTATRGSFEFYLAELENLKEQLVSKSAKTCSSKDLADSIHLYNMQRSLLRRLALFALEDPPRITGSELSRVVLAASIMPPRDANDLILSVIEEVKQRESREPSGPRLMLWGMHLDNTELIDLIESCGAHVAVSETCSGWRQYYRDVSTVLDPMLGLAKHYIEDVRCSRLFQEGGAARFDFIRDLAATFRVRGIVAYVLRYCDSLETDMPEFVAYFEKERIPVLWLEDDYSLAAKESLKTRVQAFIEMTQPD